MLGRSAGRLHADGELPLAELPRRDARGLLLVREARVGDEIRRHQARGHAEEGHYAPEKQVQRAADQLHLPHPPQRRDEERERKRNPGEGDADDHEAGVERRDPLRHGLSSLRLRCQSMMASLGYVLNFYLREEKPSGPGLEEDELALLRPGQRRIDRGGERDRPSPASACPTPTGAEAHLPQK
jgi:hypothetical protein